MNKLNSMEPNIKTYGTSETNIINMLSMLLILTVFFLLLLFKQEYIKTTLSMGATSQNSEQEII